MLEDSAASGKVEIQKIPGKYDGSLSLAKEAALRTTLILAANHSYTANFYSWASNTNHRETGNWKTIGDSILYIRNMNGKSCSFKIYPDLSLKELDKNGKELPKEQSKGLKRSTGVDKI